MIMSAFHLRSIGWGIGLAGLWVVDGVGETRYVDAASVASSPDGSEWGQSYRHLQDALAVAQSGDEIWVAGGVYYPDDGVGASADDPASSSNGF